jgi:F-type H+-transporting ATPase subunit epsilon
MERVVATPFDVRILTAEKTALEAQVVYLQAPGSEGFLGILAHHAPLITLLKPGPLTLSYPSGRREVFAVSGGFLEVSQNRVIVLADAIERADEIDVTRAGAARDRAQRRLAARERDLDALRAELALRRAINRIRVAQRQYP